MERGNNLTHFEKMKTLLFSLSILIFSSSVSYSEGSVFRWKMHLGGERFGFEENSNGYVEFERRVADMWNCKSYPEITRTKGTLIEVMDVRCSSDNWKTWSGINATCIMENGKITQGQYSSSMWLNVSGKNFPIMDRWIYISCSTYK